MTGTADKRSASVAGTERLGAALAPALAIGDEARLAGIVHARAPGAPVRSPSFTLVNEHAGPVPVYHLDLYRLSGVRDIEGLGLEEYAERGVLVVEWGERLPNEWLADALHIAITPGEGDVREFTADGRGDRGRALLRAWCALAEAW